MRTRLIYGMWLVIVWVALWKSITLANVVSGVAAAVALVTIFPPHSESRPGRFRPLASARLLGYFVVKLVEASFIVAWEVITPTTRVREGIVAVPLRGVSEVITTVVANAVSLVPGTITLEAASRPATLYVHVLHLRDPEAVRQEVRELEALAVRAFGPREAVEALKREVAGGPPLSPSQASTMATGQDEPEDA